MTVLNPPADMQNRTDHTAQVDRLALQLMLAGKATSFGTYGGVRITDGNDLKVTQNTGSDMNVKVAAGQAAVPGTENTFQGTYCVANDANVTLAIAASHATLNRIDIVVLQILDQFYSGGSSLAQLAVVTGTPAGSPVAPAAPNNSITLAQVSVAAASTAVVNANITDTRPVLSALGGVIAVKSTTAPANPVAGETVIWESDTGAVRIWDGTNWRQLNTIATQVDNANTDTTSSTTYVAPTNAQSATVYLKANQKCKVTIQARMKCSAGGAGHSAKVSFAVSGTETVGASDTNCIENISTTELTLSTTTIFTASNADGNRTFAVQFSTTNGADTTTITRRRLIVETSG